MSLEKSTSFKITKYCSLGRLYILSKILICNPVAGLVEVPWRLLMQAGTPIILRIINDAAQAYKGIIPEDRWKEPYMPEEELIEEIWAGVQFFGWKENEEVVGVMGIQPVKDTTLIRHSYVLPNYQRRGIGGKLLAYLVQFVETPKFLVGTWAAATWAIRFYEKHGFKLVAPKEKDRLLRTYWNIPERQIETSVVLKLTRNRGQWKLSSQPSNFANIVEF